MPFLTTRGTASSRGFGLQGLGKIKVEHLIVAGGGGGAGGFRNGTSYPQGISVGGGGGAGGYRSSVVGELTGQQLTAEQILEFNSKEATTIQVGAGGPGGSGHANGTVGGSSYFSSRTSLGGGFGGSATGGDGGSGGGAGFFPTAGGTRSGGVGATGQGFNGNAAGNEYGGGGGGAHSSAPSGVASYTKGARGLQSSITGTLSAYSGGGCGGSPDYAANNVYDTVNPAGGFTPTSATSIFFGGGIAGVNATGGTGVARTGGGGGGATTSIVGQTYNGGAGGSGIVIIRYPDYWGNLTIGSGLSYLNSSGSTIAGNGTTVAPTNTTAGYKIYTFVSGLGSITFP
jgi:hypothetical protein